MSDTLGLGTPARTSAGRVPRRPATAYRRARAVLATEWIKLRSLRSMPVTLLAAVFVSIWLADGVCFNDASNWPRFDAASRAAFDPLDTNLQFVVISMLIFAVFGALVATNEYVGSGLIRTTLAATPQRGMILAAKAVLVGLIGFVLSAVICFTAFVTGQALLSGHTPHVSLADPGVLGHVLGSVYFLTACGLIGLSVGALLRNAAAAISAVFAFMLVLPILVNELPADPVTRHAVPYLPFNLGWSLWHSPSSGHVSGSVAVLALAAWILVLAAVAALALRGRDA
jgi:ABC-2 type transport system permease protein